MTVGSTTIPCSSYPVAAHCRRRARIAATIGNYQRSLVPLCEDCYDRVRASGDLVESWGAITATDFARAFRRQIAPDVAAGLRPAI